MTSRRAYFACAKPITGDYIVPQGTMCVPLIVPNDDEHFALLQGLMAKLTQYENWDGIEEDNKLMAEIWQEAYVLNDWSNCPVPEDVMLNIDLWCANASSNGTPVYGDASFMPFSGVMQTETPATTPSRYLRNIVWLKAGTYEYTGWYAKQTTCGKTTIHLRSYPAGSIVDALSEIDQNGLFNAALKKTGTLTVLADDFYSIDATNTAAVGGNYRVVWTSHHLRQLS
jgi:hypothetical protein